MCDVIIMTKFICRRCNTEFISDGHIMKLSQHIIDKHHGKMYRSYLVNVSANYKNTFKHLFPYTSLSSDVVNKLECLCISLEIVFVDAHELCYP